MPDMLIRLDSKVRFTVTGSDNFVAIVRGVVDEKDRGERTAGERAPKATRRPAVKKRARSRVEKAVGEGARIKNHGYLPTSKPGLFTVSIMDRQLRKFTVTLADESTMPESIPTTFSQAYDELGVVAYEVR